jgi:hypothetical protein
MSTVIPLPAPRHVRHAGGSSPVRNAVYASMAAYFTAKGWTPAAMEACERTFGPTPVADAMRAVR